MRKTPNLQNQSPLADFSDEIFDWMSSAVGQADPCSPMLFIGMADATGKIHLSDRMPLSMVFTGGGEKLPAFVEELLSKGAHAVGVAHEAWMTTVGKGASRFVPGASRKNGGKVEVMCVSLNTATSQSMVTHPLKRRASGRVLIKGESPSAEVTLGGRMARQTPSLH